MRKNIFQIVKASAAAVIVSLIFVLIFTLIIQLFSLPLGAVKPVNQVFKILSIAIGGLIFIRGDKGIIYGFIAVIVTYLLYGAISHSLSISWKFIIEILLGVVCGAITGIIAVNIKKTA